MERNTRQRAAIAAALERAGRPLSPAELLDEAREDVESLSLQTVYRALKGLTDEGRIRAVEIPGQAARYEVAGLAHHHHFKCDCCGRVFDIPGPCPREIVQNLPKGFTVRDHDVTLFGHCADCPELGRKSEVARGGGCGHVHRSAR